MLQSMGSQRFGHDLVTKLRGNSTAAVYVSLFLLNKRVI